MKTDQLGRMVVQSCQNNTNDAFWQFAGHKALNIAGGQINDRS